MTKFSEGIIPPFTFQKRRGGGTSDPTSLRLWLHLQKFLNFFFTKKFLFFEYFGDSSNNSKKGY